MSRFLCSLLMLVLFLTAYGPVAGQEAPPRPNRDPEGVFWKPSQADYARWRVIEDVESGAVIRFWPWALTPDFDDYLAQVVANFEATYPGVEVIIEGQDASGAREMIRNAFFAGVPADVINMSDSWVAEFAEQDMLLDMDALLAAPYPDIRGQYVDGAWEKAAFNGVTYHLPWYLAFSNVMAVNGQIAAELGLEASDIPDTWAEAYAFACEVRERSQGAYYAFSFPWGELAGFGLLNDFIEEGVSIYDEDDAAVVFNADERALALVEAYKRLLEEDCIPADSLTDDVRGMVTRFAGGDILLLQTDPQLFRLIEELNPELYAQLFLDNQFTGAANIRSIGDVQVVTVSKASASPNAALAFAVFLTNPDTQTAFSQEVPIYSSNLLSYEDDFFTQGGPSLTDQLRPLAGEYFATAVNTGLLDFPNVAEVEQIVVGEFQVALLGLKPVQEALDDMAARINTIISLEGQGN